MDHLGLCLDESIRASNKMYLAEEDARGMTGLNWFRIGLSG
jgi:hypothetical protein